MTLPQTLPRGITPFALPATRNLFVVATDGRPDSDTAFRMAKLFAGTEGSVLGVAVLEQVQLVPEAQVLFSAELETQRRDELRKQVEVQIQRTLHTSAPFEMYDGDPARFIAQRAARAGARMILAGIGRHGVAARLFGGETVLRIMRISELPVLAVARDMNHFPRRVMAAIDFSEHSLRALRLAVSLAAPGATIFLTHVAPRDSVLLDWDNTYKRNILDALNGLKQKLDLPSSMVFEAVLLKGDPTNELLAYAERVDADLIAAGSHGHGFVARLLIGSVATRLVRESSCSVLAVPYTSEDAFEIVSVPNGRTTIPAQWSALLDDVSRHNVGRLGTLEEDGANLGAQVEVQTLPFMGATYDPYDGSVQVMFAANKRPTPHLTHSIKRVSAIEVQQDRAGHDVALRVAHRGGQTLLTFQPTSLGF